MIFRRLFRRKNKSPNEEVMGLKRLKAKGMNFYLDKKSLIQKSLRLELLTITLICIVLSFISFNIFNGFLKNKISKQTYISYYDDNIKEENKVRELLSKLITISNKDYNKYYNQNKGAIDSSINSLRENFTKKEEFNHQELEFILSNYGVDLNENNRDNYRNKLKELISKTMQKNSATENVREEIEKYLGSEEFIKESINEKIIYRDANVFLTDLDGNVKFSSKATYAEKINVYNIIDKMSKSKLNYRNEDQVYDRGGSRSSYRGEREFYGFYPIKIGSSNYYLVYESMLDGVEMTTYTDASAFLSFILSFITFIVIFLMITKRKISYIEYISSSLREISKGDLNYNVEIKGYDELAVLASDINYMEREIKEKMENERLAEKTKNELITNISHDLRTPLTSVMGYIGLVKDGKYESEKEREDFLNIAYNKADKLKNLIEDLFQFTKMNNEGISLKKNDIDINELIRQLMVELSPSAEKKNIEIVDSMENNKVIMNVDGEKLSRVFENLLSNAIKYSEEEQKIKIFCKDTSINTVITVENTCNNDITREELDKIFERFYRGDKSRNSDTGGSGLGLAIAKSIVELHGGDIWAELNGNIVSFKVRLYKK
ncbi:HAMP domain-containing sensor histidine kinase [Hathewaya histolytica]|uniref:histidine kinase n=1 Tax=Hathewaya histolytica TaxID=1498 RepID=A0A4U9RQY5_HATHI|nr:HAMP domain-containing sensor histidine kinase [Hathewaya histolytica]VTQ94665.1 integral membrane sensor signal transduction histidine kinase [Hathewaya histolytica]